MNKRGDEMLDRPPVGCWWRGVGGRIGADPGGSADWCADKGSSRCARRRSGACNLYFETPRTRMSQPNTPRCGPLPCAPPLAELLACAAQKESHGAIVHLHVAALITEEAAAGGTRLSLRYDRLTHLPLQCAHRCASTKRSIISRPLVTTLKWRLVVALCATYGTRKRTPRLLSAGLPTCGVHEGREWNHHPLRLARGAVHRHRDTLRQVRQRRGGVGSPDPQEDTNTTFA